MQLEDSFRAILDRYMESDNNYIADLATSGRSTILSQQY